MKEMIYPLLALRGTIVFPNMVTPLEVGRELSIYALEAAMTGDKKLVLAAQKDASVVEPLPEDIYNVGTICEIKQLLKMPEGQIRVLMEGIERVEISYFVEDGNYFKVAVEPRESIVTQDIETEALRRSVLDFFEKYVRMSKKIPNEVISSVNSISDPDRFADAVAGQILTTIEERQPLLKSCILKSAWRCCCSCFPKNLIFWSWRRRFSLRSVNRWNGPRGNITCANR